MKRTAINHLKSAPTAAWRLFWQLKWRYRIVLAVPVVAAFSGVAIEVTAQPGFCNSCHIMNDYYASWQTSGHSDVKCLECHLQPGFAGYVRGKINGLAQAVDCAVGRVGTKPNATVDDASCLRSDCHDIEELKVDSLSRGGVRFTHGNHVDKTIGGITLSCGTCHSHFEGQEHFTVNKEVCFTCHFLGAGTDNGKLVETTCQSCHEIPDKVIRRGFVRIDHREFVSYKASCEESCHKREVEQASGVEESVCLMCHDFGMEADANSVELHEIHTLSEKVECFACHGKVSHGQTRVTSVSAMMDCQSCHSDTHQIQRTIYSTEDPTTHAHGADRVLSPMFLTHVECTGCHIERTARTTGTLDSFGKVARAVPSACDTCHEAGTGNQYVPFWQKRIKGLYGQVDRKVKQIEDLAQAQTNETRAQELGRRAREARSALDSILFDGSWGVHNFKYTEALLLEVDKAASSEVNDARR